MGSTRETFRRTTSRSRPDTFWRNTAARLRGYLEKRRLPYILEREGETIVLLLNGEAGRRGCGQSQGCA